MKELGKGMRCFIFLDCCFAVSLFPLDYSCLADQGCWLPPFTMGQAMNASSLMCRYEIYIQGLITHSSDTGNVPLAPPLFFTLSQLSYCFKIPTSWPPSPVCHWQKYLKPSHLSLNPFYIGNSHVLATPNEEVQAAHICHSFSSCSFLEIAFSFAQVGISHITKRTA